MEGRPRGWGQWAWWKGGETAESDGNKWGGGGMKHDGVDYTPIKLSGRVG